MKKGGRKKGLAISMTAKHPPRYSLAHRSIVLRASSINQKLPKEGLKTVSEDILCCSRRGLINSDVFIVINCLVNQVLVVKRAYSHQPFVAEGKKALRRRKWEDNIKMDFNLKGWDGVDWIHMALTGGEIF
jgi:hypothetical protein